MPTEHDTDIMISASLKDGRGFQLNLPFVSPWAGIQEIISRVIFMSTNFWESIDKFAFDNPVLFSLGATFLLLLLLVISILIGAVLFKDKKWRHLGESLGRITGAVILVLMLDQLGWLQATGFKFPTSLKPWGATILPLLYAVIAYPLVLTGSLKISTQDPLLSLFVGLNAASGALIEEFAFRGVILYALIRAWGTTHNGILNSVVVSSLLFGLVHLLNLLAGDSLVRVIPQAVWSTLGGIAFGALVVYGQSIWPAVVFHGVINIVVRLNLLTKPDYQPTIKSMIALDLLAVPIAIYGLILLM